MHTQTQTLLHQQVFANMEVFLQTCGIFKNLFHFLSVGSSYSWPAQSYRELAVPLARSPFVLMFVLLCLWHPTWLFLLFMIFATLHVLVDFLWKSRQNKERKRENYVGLSDVVIWLAGISDLLAPLVLGWLSSKALFCYLEVYSPSDLWSWIQFFGGW